mmetsp:Transcript_34064/g.96751  ORF Transcript_34064/g.96751 Transcript_34064/m.96751 type:complete len:212 (+) Transcript_34064:468-1103(+)
MCPMTPSIKMMLIVKITMKSNTNAQKRVVNTRLMLRTIFCMVAEYLSDRKACIALADLAIRRTRTKDSLRPVVASSTMENNKVMMSKQFQNLFRPKKYALRFATRWTKISMNNHMHRKILKPSITNDTGPGCAATPVSASRKASSAAQSISTATMMQFTAVIIMPILSNTTLSDSRRQRQFIIGSPKIQRTVSIQCEPRADKGSTPDSEEK